MRVGKMAAVNSSPSSRCYRRGQTESQGRTGISTQVQSQPEKMQEEAKQTERPQEEFNAMHTEGEEDPWARPGMDEAEENLPRVPAKARSHAECTTAMTGPAEGPSEVEQEERLEEE